MEVHLAFPVMRTCRHRCRIHPTPFALPLPSLRDSPFAILKHVTLVFFRGAPPCACNFISLMAAVLASLLGSCANKLKDIIIDEAILILGVEKELTEVLRAKSRTNTVLHT